MEKGGSEARATWKNVPTKTEEKKTGMEVIRREERIVKKRDTARRCQRRSWQRNAFTPERKLKEDGNVASNIIEEIPWRFDDGK